MKLFGWAHRKLLPGSSLHNRQQNADRLAEISALNLTCGERGVQASASRDHAHAEVLTIGTLGIGNLLSRKEEGEAQEEEEEEEEEAQSTYSNHTSMNSNRASTSSNRASISSIRESVSSVDIQKLQDELQKILYFKLGQEHKDDVDRKGNEDSKAKAKKKKKDSGWYKNDTNAKEMSNVDGKSHVPSEKGSMRGVLPLHSFLEMPMDHMNNNSMSPPYKLLSKSQYLLLLQSLKSKLLHYTSPTCVKLTPPLFEKVVKPKVDRDLRRGSSMDKMLHLLRKMMNKRPQKRSKNGKEQSDYYEEDKPEAIKQEDRGEEVEEEEDQRLKWALATNSCRGSERFINYIASTMAHTKRDKKPLVSDEHLLHHYPYPFHYEEGGCLQLMLATSPSLDNESWIKTDDEYLVLEL